MGIKHADVKTTGQKGYATEWNKNHIIDDDVDWNAKKITNMATPTADTDAANKSYTDTMGNDVKLTGNQTIEGVKTFTSFPVTPSSAPTTDYQTANKKYVDDVGGGVVQFQEVSGYLSTGTSSTSDVDLMSVTMTTGAGRVLVMFSCDCQGDTAGDSGRVVLYVDDVEKFECLRGWNQHAAEMWGCLSFQHMKSVTAAQHTFKVKFARPGGSGTFYIYRRMLTVIEFT